MGDNVITFYGSNRVAKLQAPTERGGDLVQLQLGFRPVSAMATPTPSAGRKRKSTEPEQGGHGGKAAATEVITIDSDSNSGDDALTTIRHSRPNRIRRAVGQSQGRPDTPSTDSTVSSHDGDTPPPPPGSILCNVVNADGTLRAPPRPPSPLPPPEAVQLQRASVDRSSEQTQLAHTNGSVDYDEGADPLTVAKRAKKKRRAKADAGGRTVTIAPAARPPQRGARANTEGARSAGSVDSALGSSTAQSLDRLGQSQSAPHVDTAVAAADDGDEAERSERPLAGPSDASATAAAVRSKALSWLRQHVADCGRRHAGRLRRVTEHIVTHYEKNKQGDATFGRKMAARQMLERCIRSYYVKARVVATGSSVNGCGSFNSDMDLCLLPMEDSLDCGHNLLLTADDKRSKWNRMCAVKTLNKVRQLMYGNNLVERGGGVRSARNRGAFIRNNIELIPAKVPILKMHIYDNAADCDDVEIDMNVNNIAGVYNSHLLHYYAACDQRYPQLALLIKHWAIVNGINDSLNGTLNSYSLLLLLVHYLQCGASPPVLPNLQSKYPALFGSTAVPLDSLQLFRTLPNLQSGAGENGESVGELLCGFFAYYARVFRFDQHAISIRHACVIPRLQVAAWSERTAGKRYAMFVEEPFDAGNTARCVRDRDTCMGAIVDAFQAAHRVFSTEPSLQHIGVRI